MIKVLMFGWEFPPHISGGLGTACYGLTRALMAAKVRVLFVVPKLHGDEATHETFLINASTVRPKRIARRRVASPRAATTAYEANSSAVAHLHGVSPKKVTQRLEYISVPSHMVPYTLPKSTGRMSEDLTHWNYSLTSPEQKRVDVEPFKSKLGSVITEHDGQDETYAFTGTYGENLLEEVHRYARVARFIAAQNSFDVIHVHDWMTFPAGIEAQRKSKKPLVVHVHSTEYDRAGERVNPTVLEIERQGLTEANKVIAVSNWTKRILISRHHVPEEKIAVVHNGVLPKDQPAQFEFPEIGSHFVTFLGRVTHQKGPGYFVEAAHKVLKEFPDAHFIVAGAGDLLPQIIEWVAQLNMSANFHFTGFLTSDQVDSVWSLTDVYVMPSVSEPFGISPLEAIQGGVPVILSKQSGVAEVMPHAIKVDFWDTKALAAAICSVLRYESLSHVLRQNGSNHIKNLTWEKAAQDVKGVYNELRPNK